MTTTVDGTTGLTVPGTGSVVLTGSTSGSITLSAPAIAGNTTLTMPATVGTVLTNTTAPQLLPGMIHGLTLSTAGSNTTFGIAAGRATDSTVMAQMILTSAYTKTTSAWAVGSGNGSLDVGTTGNSLWYHTYLIQRSDTGVVDVLTSLSNDNSGTVTMTIASPAVVTWANHGLQIGSQVKFTTTGALPTGVTAGTTYYVISAGFAVGSFQISTSQGGSAVNTSGSQSGTHTATSVPTLPANYTYYRRIGSMKTNASAQWQTFYQSGDYFYIAQVTDFTAGGTSAATLRALSIPIGIVVRPLLSGSTVGGQNGVSIITVAPAGLSTATRYVSGTYEGQAGGDSVYTSLDGPPSNISAQIYVAVPNYAFGAYLYTSGWIDTRGKDS